MFHMYMADVMPVEAVWQVKLKLLPSSTVPEALLAMVGVWGTTAQKHNKHRLFHIQASQASTNRFRTHARTLPFANLHLPSVDAQCYALTSNVHSKAIPSYHIPNAAKQTQPKQITSIHFLPFSSRYHLRPPTAATTRHLPPNSSSHTYVSSESGHRALSQDSLQPLHTHLHPLDPHTRTHTQHTHAHLKSPCSAHLLMSQCCCSRPTSHH